MIKKIICYEKPKLNMKFYNDNMQKHFTINFLKLNLQVPKLKI